MSQIFISYAKRDRENARVLAETLEKLGWSVWWDRIIPIGRVFDEVIREEIDAAKCVIVLWSTASTASEWVKEEARFALSQHKMFPALIETVTIPFGFGSYQAADLVGWNGETQSREFDRLISDMKRILGTPPHGVEPGEREPEETTERRAEDGPELRQAKHEPVTMPAAEETETNGEESAEPLPTPSRPRADTSVSLGWLSARFRAMPRTFGALIGIVFGMVFVSVLAFTDQESASFAQVILPALVWGSWPWGIVGALIGNSRKTFIAAFIGSVSVFALVYLAKTDFDLASPAIAGSLFAPGGGIVGALVGLVIKKFGEGA